MLVDTSGDFIQHTGSKMPIDVFCEVARDDDGVSVGRGVYVTAEPTRRAASLAAKIRESPHGIVALGGSSLRLFSMFIDAELSQTLADIAPIPEPDATGELRVFLWLRSGK